MLINYRWWMLFLTGELIPYEIIVCSNNLEQNISEMSLMYPGHCIFTEEEYHTFKKDPDYLYAAMRLKHVFGNSKLTIEEVDERRNIVSG